MVDRWLLPAALCATPHRGQHLRPSEAGSAMFWVWPSFVSSGFSIDKMGLNCDASRVSPRLATHFLLLRQKKVSKEKASRSPGRCAVPCAARAERGRAELACGSDNARPDPLAAALLSPATRQRNAYGNGRKLSEERAFNPEGRGSGFASPPALPLVGDALIARREGIPAHAVMRWRVAQSQPDQGGRCLSVASSARPRLVRATQRTRRAAHSARLSFGYFSLAKQRKVPRPPGRDPAYTV